MERTKMNINADNDVEDIEPSGLVHRQQMTKNYAPPYSHPGQKLKRMWIYSSATKKAGAKNTGSDNSYRNVRLSSQKIASGSQDSCLSTKPNTAFRCSQEKETKLVECNAFREDANISAVSGIADGLTQNSKTEDTAITEAKNNAKASNINIVSLENGESQSNSGKRGKESCLKSASIYSMPIMPRKRQRTKKNSTNVAPKHSQALSRETHDKAEKLNIRLDDDKDGMLLNEELQLKENLKKMTEEIMRYEIRIASLYGRMVETNRENEILKKSNKLFYEKGFTLNAKIIDKAANEALSLSNDEDNLVVTSEERPEQFATLREKLCSESEHRVASEEPDERFPLSSYSQSPTQKLLTSSNEKNKGMNNAQHEKNLILKEKLELLESRIINRLQEYEKAQLSLEENTELLKKNSLVDDLSLSAENPLVKELRQKLIHGSDEIRKVRKFANVRVSNLKVALESEKSATKNLKKEFEDTKVYVRKSAEYIAQANRYLNKYRKTIEEQRGVITALQKKSNVTSKVEPTAKNPHPISPAIDLTDKYNQMATGYASLTKVSNIQKSDIMILNQQLDEEKLKSESLMAIIDEQTKELAQFKGTSGKLSNENALGKLSTKYDNLCQQRKKDEQLYQNRMKHLHKMYRMLLKNKDSENQSCIESMVEELEELRKLHSATRYPFGTLTRRGDVLIEKSQNQQKEFSMKDVDIFPANPLKREEDSNCKPTILLLNRLPLNK